MERFAFRNLKHALGHAANGGQAIHLHRIVRSDSPACFRQAVQRGEYIAHMFDRDEARLIRTAIRLGARGFRVERRGTPKQHVDLCGGPLRAALRECGKNTVETSANAKSAD